MTAEELRALLPEWQKRLRLQDWDIKLTVKLTSNRNAFGRMANHTKYHAATVDVILDPPNDFPVMREVLYRIENGQWLWQEEQEQPKLADTRVIEPGDPEPEEREPAQIPGLTCGVAFEHVKENQE